MKNKNVAIYDIEVYPNVFTLTAHHFLDNKRRQFEISRHRNDIGALLQYLAILRKYAFRMVGFNNIGYDYPVLHHLITQLDTETSASAATASLYDKSTAIINTDFFNRFAHHVPVYKHYVEQIDLYLIHHFDNVSRATSLKMLEFNMQMHDIRELPFPVGIDLSKSQISQLLHYNGHDVDATQVFFEESIPQIEFREALTAKYDRNFMNHNDTKIGKDYFIMQLERRLGKNICYEKVNGKRKIRQTRRDTIAIADVILPFIQFEHCTFKTLLTWFKKQVITETKGVFTGIPMGDLGELAIFSDLKTVKGNVKNLNVVVDKMKFVFGTGGIHASVHAQRIDADDDFMILDVDVTSFYPSLAIVNRLYPEHLTETFCDIYADVKEQRLNYAKGTPENAMLKLALNGVYGDSNNKFSPFFDPKYTMAITINGQLLICKLYEMLRKIPDISLIQANTDGITLRLRRDTYYDVLEACADWEVLTGLQLEYAEYDFMHIRDVNNYLCKFTGSDKVKRKGAYEHNIDWHQNFSALVVQKAAEAFIVHGTGIEDFIRNHEDDCDFFLRTKVPRSSRLVGVDPDTKSESVMQNVTRYHIATSGVELIKIMPPLPKKPDAERRIAINKGFPVREYNKLRPIRRQFINYDWYVSETQKLVNFQ